MAGVYHIGFNLGTSWLRFSEMPIHNVFISSKAFTSRQEALCKYLNNSASDSRLFLGGNCYLSLIINAFSLRAKSVFESHSSFRFLIGNNLPFVPFLFRILFPLSSICSDLGYPIIDIPSIAIWRKLIYMLSDLLLVLVSTRVLVESKSQVTRLTSYFYLAPYVIRKIYPFFVLPQAHLSFNISRQPSPINPPVLPRSYLLFRGRLNLESGILILLNAFLKSSSSPSHAKPSLFILGYGKFSQECHLSSFKYPHIIKFCHHHVSSEFLYNATSSSLITVGQLNANVPRLKYTLPHKFFESMVLSKIYLTPLYPPFIDFVRNNAVECIYLDSSGLENDRISFATALDLFFLCDLIRNLKDEFQHVYRQNILYPFVLLYPTRSFYEYCTQINRHSLAF